MSAINTALESKFRLEALQFFTRICSRCCDGLSYGWTRCICTEMRWQVLFQPIGSPVMAAVMAAVWFHRLQYCGNSTKINLLLKNVIQVLTNIVMDIFHTEGAIPLELLTQPRNLSFIVGSLLQVRVGLSGIETYGSSRRNLRNRFD